MIKTMRWFWQGINKVMNDDISKIKRWFEREKVKLFSSPINYYPLEQLGDNDCEVKFDNGDIKILRKEDIYNLKKILPRFIHEKLKIPVVIYISMNEKCRFQLKGDVWQARVIEMLLGKRVSWQPERCLTEEEVIKIMQILKSLLHISFKKDLEVEENEDLEK